MALLIFNAALRIESDDLCGFYRVVATPPGFSYVWLAFAAPWCRRAFNFDHLCSLNFDQV